MTSTNLYENSWQIRVSDPGEEGAHSHLFETTSVTLSAEPKGKDLVYHFLRKTEERVEQEITLEQSNELFKLMADYLDPVGMGNLGVQIGLLKASL
ncbi:dithiol-disulfide isomerase [Pasteurellaceae bacterium RH1A]|nr:dithiol-disulfide isomerase [Pasteurellaceae bacterium RH1A]